jgi:RNA polymerase sigma factor (sigma-70 family)
MASVVASGKPSPSWSDDHLVSACLRGEDQAWEALVDKFKNLVYSIALDYGVPVDEAADLFQSVWLDAYNGLPKLRKKSSVKSWLISLTLRKCYHWQENHRRRESREPGHLDADKLAREVEVMPVFVEELERNQLIREAIFELPERCQEMIRLLFFSTPPVPYREVAERLGLATGSIGFIRGRCLQRLRRILVKKGL